VKRSNGPASARRSARAPALLLAVSLSAACGGAEPERTGAIRATDGAGRIVTLEQPAHRIISLIPASTDIILALGAADRLLARTQFDPDPRLAALPSIGNALSPSVEWLLEQRPDLVVAWPDRQSRSVVTRLEELGIPVFSSQVQTLDDLDRGVEQFGFLLGLEARADSLRAAIRDTLDTVRAAVAGAGRPSVLYVIGLDPPITTGSGTFLDEIIEAAGGTNVFGDQKTLWPAVSVEEALRRQPDVVVIAMGESLRETVPAELRSRPGWRDMDAVRAGRIAVVDANTFNRPGPGLARAARVLAEVLHPAETSAANATALRIR
jgi:ABC-type Fe3+-hydroxamate transport system substrate-binding protein